MEEKDGMKNISKEKGMIQNSSDLVIDFSDESENEMPSSSPPRIAEQEPAQRGCIIASTESFEDLPPLRYPIILRQDGEKSKFAVKCTACKRQHYYKQYYIHPLLHLPVCATCHEEYRQSMSRAPKKGKNDPFCRWCGQNYHKLIPCNSCRASFCTRCLGQDEVARISQKFTNLSTAIMDYSLESYWNEEESSKDYRKVLRGHNKEAPLIDPDSITYSWSCLLCQPQTLSNLCEKNNWWAWRIQSLRTLRQAKILPPRSSKMRAKIFFLETLSKSTKSPTEPVVTSSSPRRSNRPRIPSTSKDYHDIIDNQESELYKRCATNKGTHKLRHNKKSAAKSQVPPIHNHNSFTNKAQYKKRTSYSNSQSTHFSHRLLLDDPFSETAEDLYPSSYQKPMPKYRCFSKGNSKLFVFPIPDTTSAATHNIIASAEEWRQSSPFTHHRDTVTLSDQDDKRVVPFLLPPEDETQVYCTACKYGFKARHPSSQYHDLIENNNFNIHHNHPYNHNNSSSRSRYKHQPTRRQFYVHPLFHLPVCEKCHTQYLLGDFVQEDGNEWFCRWCGQGRGTLYLCDTCPKSFCSQCLGGKERSRIRLLQKAAVPSRSKTTAVKPRKGVVNTQNEVQKLETADPIMLTVGESDTLTNLVVNENDTFHVSKTLEEVHAMMNEGEGEEDETDENARNETMDVAEEDHIDVVGSTTGDNGDTVGPDASSIYPLHSEIENDSLKPVDPQRATPAKYSCYCCDTDSFHRLCEQTPLWSHWRHIGQRLWQEAAARIYGNDSGVVHRDTAMPGHSLLQPLLLPTTAATTADVTSSSEDHQFHSYYNTDLSRHLLKPFHLLYEAASDSEEDHDTANNKGYCNDVVFDEDIYHCPVDDMKPLPSTHMDISENEEDEDNDDEDNDNGNDNGDDGSDSQSSDKEEEEGDEESVSSSDIQSLSSCSFHSQQSVFTAEAREEI